MHSPWSVYESESTENNMMLAGIPPRAGGVSGHGLGACAFSITGLQKKEVGCEMKGRLVAFVGVFCIAMLIASGAYADKPTDKPDKPGKPPRPGNIAVECIEFTGDLESVPEGGTVVEGCCPNAGPSPAYTMTLWLDELIPGISQEPFDGYLFAKPLRIKVKGQSTEYYQVHFCTWDVDAGLPPAEGDYFFDIRCDGDDIQYDETNDVLTVTVEDETATVWVLYDVSEDCDPSIYPYCENPCADVTPNCDPSDNPTCYHPCNVEKHVDVSFTMTKTTDLDYCE